MLMTNEMIHKAITNGELKITDFDEETLENFKLVTDLLKGLK